MIDQRKTRKTKKSHSSTKKVKSIIDRRMITPGCRFTGEVLEALAYFICQRLSSRKYEHVKFYVSGANVAGEGELKIMKYIKSMPERMQQRDVFALVGSDADLVLLAIASRVPHISILNAISTTSSSLIAQIPKRDTGAAQNQPSRGARGEVFVEIEIDKLIHEFSVLVPRENSRDTGTDFVALSIMSGNDYLPKVPQFFLHQYWDHYVRARKTPQWAHSNLIDPHTNRLNLDFLDSLLAHSPPRPLMAPPTHHFRKLAKLRQLREDLATGKLDKDDIIRKYTLPFLAPGSSATPQTEEQELMNAMFLEQEEAGEAGDDAGDIGDENPDFDDEDDDTSSSAMQIDSKAGYAGTPTGQRVMGANASANMTMKMPTPLQPSATPFAAKSPMVIATPGSVSSGDSNAPTPLQFMRDPIDVFLELKSRGSWAEYDADDHASQFIYGLEWVVNSYLRGECVSNEWFFPYSSAPGPKQLREWIVKAKVDPSIIKSLPSQHQSKSNDGKGDRTLESSSSSQSNSSIPIHTSSNNNTVYQPWMFAMMLLDSSTYDFVSRSIPMDSIAPGSYVHEVHDTSYFFGFIDSDRMAAELSKLDISAMSLEDREYSFLGNIRLFERQYDRSEEASKFNFMPKSPFDSLHASGEERTHSSSLRGMFKRVSIRDLKTHHNESGKHGQQGHGRQHRGENGGRNPDERYQSQHSRDVMRRSQEQPQQQQQPISQHGSQNHGDRRQGGHQQRSGQSQSSQHSSNAHSSQYRNQHHQQDNSRQYHSQATASSSTPVHPNNSSSNSRFSGNRGRNHGNQDHQQQNAQGRQHSKQEQPQQSAYGKRVDVGSLFGPKPTSSSISQVQTIPSTDASSLQAFSGAQPPNPFYPANSLPLASAPSNSPYMVPTTNPAGGSSAATNSLPPSYFFPLNPFGPILMPNAGGMSAPLAAPSTDASASFFQPSNPFKQQ